jgi:NADPH:quinone reductase-like Zn-dependent oxidoreductase
VRRPEQAAALQALGAEHVVLSTAPDADATLHALCAKLGVTYAFDAIAGDATDQLARALPTGGHVLVYGMLSGQPCHVDGNALVFRRLHVEGFTMYAWLEHTSMLGQLRTVRAAQRRLGDDLRSEVRATRPLADHVAALALARGSTSGGKVLLMT